MIDLNHQSGCQYENPSRPAGIAVAVNAAIDAALSVRDRAQPPRRYVSTSGLGRECLRTQRSDGRQFGFSALDGRFKGHIDGCLVGGPVAMDFPALWENKALGATPWKEVVKKGVVLARPIYAAQIALYQAYLDLPNPVLFTALNRDTFELRCELVPFNSGLAQRASDRAVEIVRASEARELLLRAALDRSSAICRGGWSNGEWHAPCAWQDRCWRAAP